MRNLTRVLFVLIMLSLIAGVLFFVLENQQSVSLVFMGWIAPAIPLAVLVMLALLAGLLIGPLLGLFIVLRGKARGSRSAG